jgi:hypothetical protein
LWVKICLISKVKESKCFNNITTSNLHYPSVIDDNVNTPVEVSGKIARRKVIMGKIY